MEGEHMQEINNINAQISQMKIDHDLFIQKQEATYNEKLITEYNKYIRLEDKMKKMLKEKDQIYNDMAKSNKESQESMKNNYEELLKDKDEQYEELVNQLKQKTIEHEMIKQQIEDDADREIYELKKSHEKELKEEQDMNVRLRGESALLKKRLLSSQKEGEDLKQKVYTMENEHVKFKDIIYGLERDLADTRKEIQERDQTIEDKEKRIFHLKSKNQELEKFKFILDFKIKELKSQIEPRERTIQEQAIQINEMVRELENLQKVILSLDLQLAELREKLSAANAEVKKEIEKNRRMKKALQAIRIDIHQASTHIQNTPMLQKTVRDMYHKYNADKDFEVTQAEDTEAKSEFLRQRDFLERTVSTLHFQATKNTNSLSYDKVRLVDENAALLVETNQLRKNLQSEVNQNRKLNSLIGSSYLTPRMAQQKVNLAAASNKEIHDAYKEHLEQNERSINALRKENRRLLNKIAEIDTSEFKHKEPE